MTQEPRKDNFPEWWVIELKKAFQLGQIYWSQADSESYKQQDKSAETLAQFEMLLDEYLEPQLKTLTDEFIYKNHVGYLSPNNKFYAPDYPTWKQDGFTPIYKEPGAKTLTNEEIIEIRQEVWDDDKFISEILFDFARAILKKAREK